ncbi:kinase-like protein [Fistulina hepatica ATCC 64428]|uniref:non-specific serine/threonine protein kinase n=1 Tax=Fistulina hepatica ATCC 64428 TaxID=1128425 RepID=A0A0D7AH65_9AGAR|nr:kinase-like protein [Fistulina hepatica ATCC 64428]
MADSSRYVYRNINPPPVILGGRYIMGECVGSGSYGQIFHATHAQTGHPVAIKFESNRIKWSVLRHEYEMYKQLAGGPGIPVVKWCGDDGNNKSMVMDLLGPSLEDLFEHCHRRFSVKTVIMLADQILSRLEFVHSRGIVHRDIKPDNFLMGIASRGNQVNIIDFGLAKRFINLASRRHIPYQRGAEYAGTTRYMSIHAHRRMEQSRRDDLESFAYVLLYFLRGSLPWQGIPRSVDKDELILARKRDQIGATLCAGYPQEFGILLDYARALPFDAAPDYIYLRHLFRDLMVRMGYRYDYIFDWSLANRR